MIGDGLQEIMGGCLTGRTSRKLQLQLKMTLKVVPVVSNVKECVGVFPFFFIVLHFAGAVGSAMVE